MRELKITGNRRTGKTTAAKALAENLAKSRRVNIGWVGQRYSFEALEFTAYKRRSYDRVEYNNESTIRFHATDLRGVGGFDLLIVDEVLFLRGKEKEFAQQLPYVMNPDGLVVWTITVNEESKINGTS